MDGRGSKEVIGRLYVLAPRVRGDLRSCLAYFTFEGSYIK